MGVRKFIKEHKTELIIGAISITSLAISLRISIKTGSERLKLIRLSQELEKKMEATFLALYKIHPIQPINSIPEFKGWRSQLMSFGIYTVGDLVRLIRNHGNTTFIRDIPGIGPSGYESICRFLAKYATSTFKKIYL